MVAPVAPTILKTKGSKLGSSAEKEDKTIQVGGMKSGAEFIKTKMKKIPRYDHSKKTSKKSANRLDKITLHLNPWIN